ncbi:hypothetical protein CRV24_001186 [Beauveria bassiana]|nr:hypothetical protein CRV24_001186 [Beauveria bassiana]KAH8720229.1 hypothetical protein HC256_000632 [Beauveria bassiana]
MARALWLTLQPLCALLSKYFAKEVPTYRGILTRAALKSPLQTSIPATEARYQNALRPVSGLLITMKCKKDEQ